LNINYLLTSSIAPNTTILMRLPWVFASNILYPEGVAVDGAGNVYVAYDNSNVEEIPANGGAVINLAKNAFKYTVGIAVDAAGNIYVADADSTQISEIPAGGGAIKSIGSEIYNATGVAVDAHGNIFVASYDNYKTILESSNGSAFYAVGSGFSNPHGIAVDAAGNVYVGDSGNGAVKKVQTLGGYFINPALPAGLSLNDTTGVISGEPTTVSATIPLRHIMLQAAAAQI
jgi:hypothetical protein